jgi:hypothetical protein
LKSRNTVMVISCRWQRPVSRPWFEGGNMPLVWELCENGIPFFFGTWSKHHRKWRTPRKPRRSLGCWKGWLPDGLRWSHVVSKILDSVTHADMHAYVIDSLKTYFKDILYLYCKYFKGIVDI